MWSLGSKFKNKLMAHLEILYFFFLLFTSNNFWRRWDVVCHTRWIMNYFMLLEHMASLEVHIVTIKLQKKTQTNLRFIFTNMGFNLRPTDVQAAIGFNQLKRLTQFSKIRLLNRAKIIKALKKSKKWKNQFTFLPTPNTIKPSWFSLVILINEKFLKKKKKFIKFLTSKGIETRPIISGNFLNNLH